MISAAGELQNVLASIQTLEGWTVSRLPTGKFRISSPQGLALTPAASNLSADDFLLTLEELDRIGYSNAVRSEPGRRQIKDERQRQHNAKSADLHIPDHKDTMMAPASGSSEFTRLTVRQASPDPARQGGKRYTKSSVLITPQIAEAFRDLIDREHNRGERPANRRKFTRIIREGKFTHTHQGFAFNTEGKLSDGQHRILGFLEALAEEPELFEDEERWPRVDITYNMPVDSAYAMDGGANRSAKDHAAVAGVRDASKVVPLVQLLHRYTVGRDTPNSWRDLPTLMPDEIPPLCDRWGDDLLDALTEVRAAMRRGKFKANVNALSVGYYLAKRAWDGHLNGVPVSTEVADGETVPLHPVDDFLDALSEDTRRPRNSPQRALSTWLTGAANQQRKGTSTPQTYLAMFLLAYNDFVQGHERQQVSWLPSRGIPRAFRPEGLPEEDEE